MDVHFTLCRNFLWPKNIHDFSAKAYKSFLIFFSLKHLKVTATFHDTFLIRKQFTLANKSNYITREKFCHLPTTFFPIKHATDINQEQCSNMLNPLQEDLIDIIGFACSRIMVPQTFLWESIQIINTRAVTTNGGMT